MQDLMEFALAIAREAGQVTMRHFRDAGLVVERKADTSPVTVADHEAEVALRAAITARFPDDGIVGEEGQDVPSASGRTWYFDPIDGTKSFVHGVPLFTTLVACHDGDGPLVGVIHAPALDEGVWAGRGAGCFHASGPGDGGTPARVSSVADVADAYVMTSGLEWWPEDLISRIPTGYRRPREAGRPPFMLRTWGDGYGYMLVATGRAEAMVDHDVAIWDVAPMPVVIGEAGGRFTSPPDGGRGVFLASNGLVHDPVMDWLGG